MQRPSSFFTPAALAVLFLAGSLVYHAAAQGPAPAPAPAPVAAPTPTRLAVINIVKAFASLNEKIDGDAEIEAEGKKINDDRRKKEDKLKALTDSLANPQFNKDSPEYKKLQDDVLNAGMDLQVFLSVAEQRLMLMQRLKTLSIYRSMNDAVKKYAESHGIAIVFVADDMDFSGAKDTAGVTSRIAMRKVLYAHPDYDITTAIIEQMNAEYRLGTK